MPRDWRSSSHLRRRQRGLLLKDSLELCRCSEAKCLLLCCCNQPRAYWELCLQRERERGGREKRGVREGDRLPPWRGSLHMPQWLLSQQTHRCPTGDILAPYQYSPTFRRVKCLNTKAWNVRLNFPLLRRAESIVDLLIFFFPLSEYWLQGATVQMWFGWHEFKLQGPYYLKRKKKVCRKMVQALVSHICRQIIPPKKTQMQSSSGVFMHTHTQRTQNMNQEGWGWVGEEEEGERECNPSPSICAVPQGQIRGSKPSWENPFFPLTSAAVILCAMTAEQCRCR